MKTFQKIIPIIKDTLWSKSDAFCPLCDSKNITDNGYSMTLVGGDPDPNHYWHDCFCRDCNEKFIWEHKYNYTGTHHWYVHDNIIIEGLCICCASNRKYQCECGDIIESFYTQFGKRTQSLLYDFRNNIEKPKLNYECKCGFNRSSSE